MPVLSFLSLLNKNEDMNSHSHSVANKKGCGILQREELKHLKTNLLDYYECGLNTDIQLYEQSSFPELKRVPKMQLISLAV